MRAPSLFIILNVQSQLLFPLHFPQAQHATAASISSFLQYIFLLSMFQACLDSEFLATVSSTVTGLCFCSSYTWIHIRNTMYRHGTKCASHSREVGSEGELLCWRVLWLTREWTGLTASRVQQHESQRALDNSGIGSRLFRQSLVEDYLPIFNW